MWIPRMLWNYNDYECDICVKFRITKKICHFVEREFELLGLIHTDIADLKQTMSRGVKIIL